MLRSALIALAVSAVGCSDTLLTGPPEQPTPPELTPPEPIPEEECNGVDDDLDGEADEGFTDSDGDGRADCVDPPPCDLLEVSPGGSVDVDPACHGDVFELVPELFLPASSSGGLSFGPVEDSDGNGLSAADPHAFVFLELDRYTEPWWEASSESYPTQLRVLSPSEDRLIDVDAPAGAGFSLLAEGGVPQVLTALAMGPPEDGWSEVVVGQVDLDGLVRWSHPQPHSLPVGLGEGPTRYGRGNLWVQEVDGDLQWDVVGDGWWRVGGVDLDQAGRLNQGLYLTGQIREPRATVVDLDLDGHAEMLSFFEGPISVPQQWWWPMPDPAGLISEWFGWDAPPLLGLVWESGYPGGLLRQDAIPAQLDADPEPETLWLGNFLRPDYVPTGTPMIDMAIVAIDNDGSWLWARNLWEAAQPGSCYCPVSSWLGGGGSGLYPDGLPWLTVDADDDGYSELYGHFLCRGLGFDPDCDALFALDHDGTVLWNDADELDYLGRPHSGYAPSAFDFDGDGTDELALWVDHQLQIRSTADGAVLASTSLVIPAPTWIGSTTTWTHLPIVDVDGDGSAEIVVPYAVDPFGTGQEGIAVFGHPKQAWPSTGRVWTDDHQISTCVGEDLEPRECGAWWADGVPSSGNVATGPATPLPEARIALQVTGSCAQCPQSGEPVVRIAVQVSNEGPHDWNSGGAVRVTDPAGATLIGYVEFLGPIPSGQALEGIVIELEEPAVALAEGLAIHLELDLNDGGVDLCAPPPILLRPVMNCQQ